MKKLLALVASAAFVAGCSTTNTQTVHVTDSRPPVAVEAVKIVRDVPSNSIYLAAIVSKSSASAKGCETAQMELKRSAAAVGANFIVLQNWNSDDFANALPMCGPGQFVIEARAYYVP